MQANSNLPDFGIDFVDEVLVPKLKEQTTAQLIDALNDEMNAQVDTARHLKILIEAAYEALPDKSDHSLAMLSSAGALIKRGIGDVTQVGSVVRELLERGGGGSPTCTPGPQRRSLINEAAEVSFPRADLEDLRLWLCSASALAEAESEWVDKQKDPCIILLDRAVLMVEDVLSSADKEARREPAS